MSKIPENIHTVVQPSDLDKQIDNALQKIKGDITDMPFEEMVRSTFVCPRCHNFLYLYSDGWHCFNCGYWVLETEFEVNMP